MVACYLGQDGFCGDSSRTRPELSRDSQLYNPESRLLESVLWVTETEPTSVAAPMKTRGNGVDINNALAVTLDRDGDTVTTSIDVTGGGPSLSGSFVDWGTNGRIEYYDGNGAVETADDRHGLPSEIAYYEELTQRKLDAFRNAVAGDRECAVLVEFDLRIIEPTETAYCVWESGEVSRLTINRSVIDTQSPNTRWR